MAENKKSFVAYSDWHGMFKMLPDEVAGKLIKHVFSYVNDENPTTDDYVINALFEQIKSTLKRDLIKWEEQREQRSLAGKRSAEIRATKFNERSTVVDSRARNSTVSVSVSDSVSVNEIKENNNKALPFKFFDSLISLGAEKQLVSDWISVRKTKKLSNTKTAFDNFKIEVEKSGKNINEVLKECVINSWGGFKANWLNKQEKETTSLPIINKRKEF